MFHTGVLYTYHITLPLEYSITWPYISHTCYNGRVVLVVPPSIFPLVAWGTCSEWEQSRSVLDDRSKEILYRYGAPYRKRLKH